MKKYEHLFRVMYHLCETYWSAFSKLIQNNCHCTKKANKNALEIYTSTV